MTVFPQIGVIGVGNMGGGMARNLLARGWPVRVEDLDSAKTEFFKEKGAEVPVNIEEFAINCEAIIICVVTAEQTESVLFGDDANNPGLAHHLQAGQTVMLCPTMAPQDTERFAARLSEYGIDTIDAPMSGGPARAADGSMSLMVACLDAVFERHSALITALSNKVFRISQRVGDGARTKLVNNLLAGINLVGASEVLVMAKTMGLDVGKTLDVIELSSGQSWIGLDRMRRAIEGDFAPRAHMTLLEKDTRLAVQAGAVAGFEGPLGAAARDVFAAASAGGLSDLDDAALFTWLQSRPASA